MENSSFRTLVVLLAIGLIAFGAAAQAADTIMIGTNSGEIFGRGEYDLATHVVSSYVNFGSTMPIGELAGANGKVIIGVNASGSANIFARDINNMSVNLGTLTVGTTNSAVTAMSMYGTDSVLIGQTGPSGYWSGTFVRTVADLDTTPASYTGGSVPAPGDGWNWGQGITGMDAFDNGDFLVGCDTGYVTTRRSTDIFNYVTDVVPGHGGVNFGTPITAVAALTSDTFAVALSTGYMDVRLRNDAWANVGLGVNWGIGITSLVSLGNNNIAIGLANGQVHVRSAADLTGASLTYAAFTGGAAITAMALTSDGNLAIGTADNLLFVRKATDLSATPDGFLGSDGLNFGAPITAIAAVNPVPEPSCLVALGTALSGLALWRRRR